MKKILFIIACVATLFFVSCGGHKSGPKGGKNRERQQTTIEKGNYSKSNRVGQQNNPPIVKNSDAKYDGASIFKKYNSAVFMIYSSKGQGSGFFVNDKGLAVSNYHVLGGTIIGKEAIKIGNYYYKNGKFENILDTSLGTNLPFYKYDEKRSPGGRFKFNNFKQWYEGRMLANPNYFGKVGISPTRAVTSSYSMGYPVNKKVRYVLKNEPANPDKYDIDYSNYYRLTDNHRGNAKMDAHLYNEIRKNPEAAYKYLQYIIERNSTWNTIKSLFGNNEDFNKKKAEELQKAARMSNYHDELFKSEIGNILTQPFREKFHKRYSTAKSFYENAFENGKLKNNFDYSENGYDRQFDGGNYVVHIRNGKFDFAEDEWNQDLNGFDLNLNAGMKHKVKTGQGEKIKERTGFPIIKRNTNK